VANAEVSQIPNDFYEGPPQQPLSVHKEAGGVTVADLRVDVGGIQPFVAEGYTDVEGVEADLQLSGDEAGELWLGGTVRNGDVALQEAVLIAGNGEQRLGDLGANELADIGFALNVGSAVTSTMAPLYYGETGMVERILGPGDYWNNATLHRRYQFLQAISNLSAPFGSGQVSDVSQAGLGPSVHLVGWVEGEHALSVEVEVDARSVAPSETALYVYTLQAASAHASATVSVPPSLITREVVETAGYVDAQSGRLYLDTESQAVFRFTVWPAAMVRQVDGLVMDMWWSGSGYAEGSPAVFLWNHEGDEWDRLDVGWGRHRIAGAGVYVSQSGRVLLRLKASEMWPAEMENVTITIEGQH
jgi:hypothetical protein